MKKLMIVAFAAGLAAAAGCAVILGSEEPSTEMPGGQVQIDYVETLRDQASLNGESFLANKVYSDAAQAAAALHVPTAVAADTFRVYVTDRSPEGRLVIFDRGDRTVTVVSGPTPSLPAPAAGFTRFVDPSAVAVDSGGVIYVADARLGRVVGLDRRGAVLLVIGQRGELASPSALAVDPGRNRLYVADQAAGRVRVFTLQGDQLFDLGEGGKKDDLRMPVGVTVSGAGDCYVLDARTNRVVVYDAGGVPRQSFHLTSGSDGKPVKPAGIALDSSGHIYVPDSFHNTILIYAQDGTFLRRWGSMGSRQDELWSPAGIFIDNRDMIYIADQMNSRVQVYQYTK